MSKRSYKIKLVAAFVIAFVCMNAGGAVCVAYCQSFEIAAIEAPEHCPLKKAGSHCDKAGEGEDKRDSIATQAGELDCCPMTVSFFAAPIEKNSLSFSRPAVATASSPRSFELEFAVDRTLPTTANYRGPPLIDRRNLRIQHCILRI
jgi:hypothetical protein